MARASAGARTSGPARTLTGDAAGLGLALALAAWTVASAFVTGADRLDAWLVVALIALTAGGFAVGRTIGVRSAVLVPAAVALAVLVATLSAWPVAGGGFQPGVLGYSNASAELAVQGFAAALTVVAIARRSVLSAVAGLVALVLAAATLLGDSVAAQVLLLLPAAALVAAFARVGGRWIVGGLALLVLGALVVTIALGVTGEGSDRDRATNPLIESTLSGRRTALWHDALVLMKGNPVFGVGPGRFEQESPTARSDRDARWAHHAFLQMGAETGIPGLLLLAGLFAWGFARLGLLGAPDAPAIVAAGALAALGIHACVDYVLHFPALPLAAAALFGAVAPRTTDPGGTT